MLPAEFLAHPAVFAVKKEYQIMVPVSCETLMWAEIGGERYFDEVNGIIRSGRDIHKVTVPMEALDAAGGYDICFRRVISRKPYYTETEEPERVHYSFKPLPESGPIHIYHSADSHGLTDAPSKAGTFYGDKLDLLILNGDIVDHSGEGKKFLAIYEIASAITGGGIPVVFARGNHDLRGICAEKLTDWSPSDGGNSYFTFRLGRLWGMVLDCGEDKLDSNAEYGNTVCCHGFRNRQTAFMENVIKNKNSEYGAEGVVYRFIVVHNPFTRTLKSPFDIEQEIYSRWAELLREEIKPQLMFCGHTHETRIYEVGGEFDDKGQPCPVIVGSEIKKRTGEFTGAAAEISGDTAEVLFTDTEHKITERHTLKI